VSEYFWQYCVYFCPSSTASDLTSTRGTKLAQDSWTTVISCYYFYSRYLAVIRLFHLCLCMIYGSEPDVNTMRHVWSKHFQYQTWQWWVRQVHREYICIQCLHAVTHQVNSSGQRVRRKDTQLWFDYIKLHLASENATRPVSHLLTWETLKLAISQ